MVATLPCVEKAVCYGERGYVIRIRNSLELRVRDQWSSGQDDNNTEEQKMNDATDTHESIMQEQNQGPKKTTGARRFRCGVRMATTRAY